MNIQGMVAVDQLVDIGFRLQRIAGQMAWLQHQVWQRTMMTGAGHAPRGPEASVRPGAAGAPGESETQDVRLYVDQRLCGGCGLCARIAPRTFRIDPHTGRAVGLSEPGDPPSAIRTAVARCPLRAIHYR